MIAKLVVFAALTVFLLIVTIIAQKERRTWAWARFGAFEMNAALILLNLEYWAADPLSPLQIASWVFLLASLYLLAQGVCLLLTRGKPDGYFERTTELVTSGVYRFVRHPMYASLFYLTLGVVLKNPSPSVILLGLISLAAVLATARIEQGENLAKFGPEYGEYMKRSKMFVPFVF